MVNDAPALLLHLDPADTVAMTATDLPQGTCATTAGGRTFTLRRSVPAGHKVALCGHAAGARVVKYGHSIGLAGVPIEPGDWVHTHNLASAVAGELDYGPPPEAFPGHRPCTPPASPESFSGYRREDGRAGVRNQIWIIPTVGCIDGIARGLAEEANRRFRPDPDFPGAGILALSHPYGCSQLGDDLGHTRRILASLARHPNAAGVLVLGLGCENNELETFLQEIGPRPDGSLEALRLQDPGDEFDLAMGCLERLARRAETFVREPMPVSELVIGLKCGGSDAFSGITANPLVGRISDILVASGGSALLTEVPEMFGAEHGLLARAASAEAWRSTVDLVNHWKAYFLGYGRGSHENPSPGNRDGGITTIEEKSLGCVRKAGTGNVVDVVPYGGGVRMRGVSLVSGPGNDLVSSTALAAAGAQIILFTTGRGTPFGSIVPTIKISSTTGLAERKPGWIDADAGPLLAGASSEAVTAGLWKTVIATAGGAPTRNERSGCRGIAIFKDGVTL